VAKPEDWKWSSFRHYAKGMEGTVEMSPSGPRHEEAACRMSFDSPRRSHHPISQKRDVGHPVS
jgi:hypothetical protein